MTNSLVCETRMRRFTGVKAYLFAVTVLAMTAFGDSITPYAVNNNGLIVGQDYTTAGTYESFLYNTGTGVFTFLTPPGSTQSIAVGINDSNQVVGAYLNGTGNYGYLYSGGTFSTLSVPGAHISTPFFYYGGAGTLASGINDNGDIVGDWSPTNSSPGQGFFYNGTSFSNTTISSPGAATTQLYDVNDSGQISGFTVTGSGATAVRAGFIDNGGVFTAINFPGASSTIAQGINDSGEVVGFYTLNGVTSGFIYQDGTFTTIVYPGASATDLFGISNNGEIVGSYTCASGCDPAFYATPLPGGGYSFQTFAIATPEPGTIALLGAGLVALLIQKTRRV